jgi:hypothetical protein
VYYGAGDRWFSRGAVTGSVSCSNATFGDPAPGVAKSCYYVAAKKCADERGTCTVAAGATATVLYGGNGRFHLRSGASGAVACSNATFGDPIPGVRKACWLR